MPRRRAARATLSRFDDPHVIHHRWSLIRSRLQLDRVLEGIEAEPGPVESDEGEAELAKVHEQLRLFMEWTPEKAGVPYAAPGSPRAWLDTLGAALGLFLALDAKVRHAL